jgi:hypothetical protein
MPTGQTRLRQGNFPSAPPQTLDLAKIDSARSESCPVMRPQPDFWTPLQIFAMGGCKSWAAMLEVRNNELWIVHRGNCVAAPEFEVRLASDIPRNQWNPVIMHFVASNLGAGSIEV